MSEEAPKNPLLFILVVVNSLVAFYLLSNQYDYEDKVNKLVDQSASAAEKSFESPYIPKPKEGSNIAEYPFGNFSINLARPSGPQRFIKVDITFIVETPADNDLTEIINKTPGLRDEIIGIFNNQTPRDVLKLEGRSVLKNLLKNHINRQLKDDEVLKVLFTKFTVS